MKNHKLPSRLLSLVLCICMVLSLMPMMPLVAEAATVPNYISSIGISQDGSSGSTGINDCKSELAGHTIIDVDLNDEAGGDYVYMGYKTTTDPAQAITGIVFRVGKNPPNSISYGGSTFYLVGGSTEANTAKLGGYIDLNARAGGYYIYTYVTRDPNYGAPLTNLTVNRSSSYSGWYAGTDTNGNVMDLNDDASNYYLYLHYQRFSGKASSTFYYLTSGGSRTSSTTSVSVKNHTQSVSTTPSVPSTVTYDGRTFTFRGWREDNTASSSTVSPSYSYMTSKTYRAVYSATVALSYNANGGSGAPSRQTATQYINAGSSSVSKTSHSFTISATKPTHDDSKCVFLGWSTGSSATSASHQPGQTITISSNTTLYAVWRGAHTANRTYVNNGANHTYTWPCCGKSVTEAHSYTDGFCVCGAMIPDAVATVSKNGKVVAAYTILNDAIQAVQDCTAADEVVVTILKGIALGDNYQTISSGVFTIDLNGFEISNTNSDYGALYVYGATVTIRDSGEDGKITGKRAGIEVFEGELTVLDGTVSGGSSRDNYGVYASGSSTVTISGGSFSGYNGVYAAGSSTVTISGGTISGESAGVYADRSNVNISSGNISSDTCGVNARNKSTAKISGGTISSHDYGVCVYYSTVTVSDGIVSGDFRGVDAYYSTVTISGGSVSGDASGVYAYNASTVTISGGTVSGDDFGVDAYVSSTVTISGGTVSGVSCGVYACNKSTATLSGGSISGDQYDIRNINSTIALTLGEDGVGATFPGGITVLDTTLNEILGEGAAYWQGNTMILPADDATEITGGDVVIKSTCPHASKSNYTDLKDGESHTYFCSGCNNTLTESHSYTNLLCVCGAASSDAVASVSKNGKVVAAYTTLNDAIQAVKNCTAADKAVVTILQDIALGDDLQSISSGVFTIDLNGHEISSTNATWGALYISESASNVTIQGTGENSKITGNYAGIEMNHGANVTIAGGTISGDWYGVFTSGGNMTISGGSISSINYDIACYSSIVTLTVGEDGVGATFPGGIEVRNTTLNAILGEGAAYWQGNTMIIPDNKATEITGGDVVIKAECKHPSDKTYTNNGDDHSYTYSCCNNTVTESHSYTNGLCVCGAMVSDAVASVSKNGIVTGAYTTLNDAIQAVRNCTAADKAVVTILQDIALGDSYQKISSGVFTIDLNSKTLSGTNSTYGVLYLIGSGVKVTVTDSGTGGTISGYYGVNAAYDGWVTISGGTISGEQSGVVAQDFGTVTITGGTISGEKHGLAAYFGGRVIISGGIISGEKHGVYANDSIVMIKGGSISGDSYDIFNYASTMILTLGENGVGATFPGGIKVYDTTLNEILDEGAAYWQGNTMILPADGATEITGGDVVIKAVCPHTASKTGYVDLKDGANHTYVCSGCNVTFTEVHSYDATTLLCVCGAAHSDAVASVSKNGVVTGAYTTLNDAIQAVKYCTAADEAVVTILKDIALGDSYQKTYSGEFTIDLNGHEISNTNTFRAALYIASDAAKVTIQGAGENSKIIGEYAGITVDADAMLTITGGSISGVECGVETSSSIVTISGGTIRGDRNGVRADGSTVTITDGTISGGYEGVYTYESTVTISGGTISGGYEGVYAYINSTVTISGGTISGEEDGVYASNSTVTITGGTISGNEYGVDAGYSTVTISGGTISGDYWGLYAFKGTVTISDGTISGDSCGVWTEHDSTVAISGGTISGDYSVDVGDSTVTISGGTISGDYGVDATYSTVTISGGTISGGLYGVNAGNSTVTISGGRISGDFYDICNSYSTGTLTLGEDGVGATFPGGITVLDTTLNEILDEGAAYWQGDKQINPADDDTEITGGDVVIKAACKHPGDKTYTNNGDDHTYTCSICDATVTEGHTYIDGVCVCGVADVNAAVASTTVGGITTYYGTLGSAIQAVKDCTAADKAVVTILKDIALGVNYQTISSGVFTIDLNGHEISSTDSAMGVLYLRTDAVNVTIQGAGENSKITGSYDGIELYSATLTINGGTISGGNHAVRTSRGTVTISGGRLSGGNDCVWADLNSTVTISGGRISGGVYDIVNSDSTITLTLGENGMGATFPGGIMVKGTTLNAILGEDAVYCQGNAMVIPADDATEISRGDVVIKAFCDHSGNVNVDDNDCSTNLVCSVCNLIISYSSDHDYDDNGFCVNCGDYQPAVLKDGWYQITNGGNLFWFAQLVSNRTSDANAVLTNDVDLENRDWIPMGNAIAYEGIINGAGYTVSGLKVSGNRQYSGFIGQLSNGGVKNLTLSGTVDATCGSSGYVGLMVGHMTDSALYNCSVSGSVKALAHALLYMGGLVGSANHCVIINCGSEADVTLLRGYSDETAYVGGLAGEVKVGNENPVCLLNSYAVGNITVGTEENPWSGTVHAGGIVGYLRDDAVNNYFYGDIDVHCDGTSNVGYAFGYVQGYSYLAYLDNASSEDAPTELIISNNYYPEGKTAVGAGKIYVDGAGQSGIDESWTTAVSEANIKATSGENALVYILNSNVPYVERIIEEHLGFLSESEWAAIVENIGGKNFAAQMWVVKNGHPVHDKYSGWTEINGNWYYYDPETGKPVTGVVRVPYPAEAINGVTYGPNMEDVKYANDKGTLFKDSISAFFVFDENGVFQSGLNGMTSDNRWAVNGCIVWHVGLVQVGEDYYYFIGDVDNGGNKMATSDTYANRNTTDFDMVPGGVYTFSEDGKLCKNEGIVDLRYYENYRLMLGNGLTKVGENYIYVNSKGELIVDAEYYVPSNDLGIASGVYAFDENGFMIQPVSTDKDGIYFENDAWYYYESGEKQYGLGLIGVSKYWYYPDGTRFGTTATIYVRSNGQLATGEYYVTNVDNYDFGGVASGTKMIFSEEGMQYASKNGIYEIDGSLYYFVNNQIQYNAGLIELGGGWIYVRSNGQLAVGEYWITNTNGNLDAGMYEFGTDGYLVITDVEDGIVEENDVLYYYLDGKKQYGLGLRQLEDGSYIYVRTNGQLATGSYWITNHNGLLPEGMYTFGEDGILVEN